MIPVYETENPQPVAGGPEANEDSTPYLRKQSIEPDIHRTIPPRVKPKVDGTTSIYVAVVVRRRDMPASQRRNRLGDEFRRRELLTRLDLDLQGLILALVEGLQSAAPST